MNININNIILPQTVKYIISSLESNGFETFVVGGAVRDILLNKIPKDFDIATSATPKEIIRIFSNKGHKTFDVGKSFGTIIINIEGINYEITTYRIEEAYIDNRKPSKICFSKDIYEDLKRRDFTINAMAYNQKVGILDFFNGRDDLKNNIIRTVGEPSVRFNEDALRMLRAIRFNSRLGFEIDKTVKKAILKNKFLIRNISFERINMEINKIIFSKNPYLGIRQLIDTELIYEILDINKINLNKNMHLKWCDELSEVFNNLSIEGNERVAFFYYFILKYVIQEQTPKRSFQILKRLKYDKNTIECISTIIKYLYYIPNINSLIEMKNFINTIKPHNIVAYLNILKLFSEEVSDKNLNNIAINIYEYYDFIKQNKIPITIKDLKINGNDLIVLGFKEGKTIKYMLEKLLHLAIEDPNLNNKETLLKLAKKGFKN